MYRNIILPFRLRGRETWSLTLREEHSLRALENRVVRKIFGPNTDELTGEWRRLHKEDCGKTGKYSLGDITLQG
jgi:hypothetical protein